MRSDRFARRPTRALVALATTISVGVLAIGLVGTTPTGAQSKGERAGAKGGNATFAELVTEPPSYWFPMYTSAYWTTAYIPWVSYLVYPPLYRWGKDGKTEFNETLALADKPVLSTNSTGDSVATITLKKRYWSDGTPVTTRDVEFWMNLLEANKTTFAPYVPGEFPDNVKQMKYLSATEFQVVFNGKYSSYWLLGNELTQITPIPQQTWDKTSTSAPVGNYDTTPSGAKAVYEYLQSQAKKPSNFASDPLWKVVDGPWEVESYDVTNGQISFVPNPKYPWPQSHKLSEFTEVPYTSTTAELDALESGQLDVGYVPLTSLSTIPHLKSEGYKIAYWTQAAFGGLILQYAKDDPATPILDQLYVRQALTHLLNMNEISKKVFEGTATYASGPVPNPAGHGQYVSAEEKKDPYPYSVSAAKKLLAEHGWHVTASGTTCTKPGTAGNECGKGIAKGAKLSFTIIGTESAETTYELLQYIDSQFSLVGAKMHVKLVSESALPSDAAECEGLSKCPWDMELWMGEWPLGWTPYVETGTNTFFCGATSNYLSVCTAHDDTLIDANTKSTDTLEVLENWENYMVKEQLQIYLPEPAYRVVAYKKTLHGVTPLDPYLQIYPTEWYFTK